MSWACTVSSKTREHGLNKYCSNYSANLIRKHRLLEGMIKKDGKG